LPDALEANRPHIRTCRDERAPADESAGGLKVSERIVAWDKQGLSKCHDDLVIRNAPATDEQPAKPDNAVSQDVLGRYRTTGFFRWYPAVVAVASVLMGIGQFVETHQWRGLAFAAAWTALAVTVWVVPGTVISEEGVRFSGRRIIPWSRVVDVAVRPSREGQKQNPPDLLLREGVRTPLSCLDASQADGLRSLARRNGAPLPP
jgi:hypothetical protein